MIRKKDLKGHRVTLNFTGGVLTMHLVHPETGCKRAFDAPKSDPEPCWLMSWFENSTPEELLAGQIEFPINAEWHGDHPEVYIVAEGKEVHA